MGVDGIGNGCFIKIYTSLFSFLNNIILQVEKIIYLKTVICKFYCLLADFFSVVTFCRISAYLLKNVDWAESSRLFGL